MKRLKLIALDEEDLSVISAYCQDAILKTADLQYFPGENRFVVQMNRFVWEQVVGKTKSYERRRTVLHFERVERVQMQGIDRTNDEQVLSLLAINFGEGEAPAGVVELAFAGGATLRLEVECLEAQLSDLAAAWETESRPDHNIGS
ncbi:MAG: DUF2948 family protein [Rhizobiaceae bacterium]